MKKIKSIRVKMLIFFMFLFLILLVSLYTFYRISMRNIYFVTTESMEKMLNQMNMEISKIMNDAERISYIVAGESEIQKVLRKDLPTDEKQLYKERLLFNYELLYMNRFIKHVDGIYVIGDNGAFFRSSECSPRRGDFRKKQWYQEVITKKKTVWIKTHAGSEMVHNLNADTISVGVPIKDRASRRVLGAVVSDILVEVLKASEPGDLVFKGKTLILDKNDNTIYSDTEDLQLQKGVKEALKKDEDDKGDAQQIVRNITIARQNYLYAEMQLESNNWKLIALISHAEMYESIGGMKVIMLVNIVAFIILAVVFALMGSNNISQPIRQMCWIMKNVETGNFDVSMEVNSQDEVGELAKSFNHMLKKIKQLMETERKSQEKLRLAEFKAFQSQINPHFLYNTLDSINWMARMNQNEKIEEVIHALTVLLRIGVSRGRNYISLGEELAHVKSYLSIQKNRYEKILDTEINVPEQLYQYKVLKVILQPLVENAIYHGIKEIGIRGKITISAREEIDKIIICVEDTGIGMAKVKLDEIQNMMRRGIDYNPNAYGVINVQKRIQMYFGKQYGLNYESEYEKGTRVYVILPKWEGNEYDVESSNRGG